MKEDGSSHCRHAMKHWGHYNLMPFLLQCWPTQTCEGDGRRVGGWCVYWTESWGSVQHAICTCIHCRYSSHVLLAYSHSPLQEHRGLLNIKYPVEVSVWLSSNDRVNTSLWLVGYTGTITIDVDVSHVSVRWACARDKLEDICHIMKGTDLPDYTALLLYSIVRHTCTSIIMYMYTCMCIM